MILLSSACQLVSFSGLVAKSPLHMWVVSSVSKVSASVKDTRKITPTFITYKSRGKHTHINSTRGDKLQLGIKTRCVNQARGAWAHA